ncbi:hypothetical protein B0H11DRAFT_1916542 [Mycena galericulata]|nr:hypothetical protein B0H11DRAFT_1916542 [Mycena galericulata]
MPATKSKKKSFFDVIAIDLPNPVAASAAPSTTPPDAAPLRSQFAKDQLAEATRFKKESIKASTQRIEDATTFDDLARVFGDVLQWTEGNKTISVEFGKVLRAIQERLVNHLTIVQQSASQHKAIASLSKELENIKKPHASYAAALTSVAAALPPLAAPPPKPKSPPLPSPATCPELYRHSLLTFAGLRMDYTSINLGNFRPELSTIILPMLHDITSFLDIAFILPLGAREADLVPSIVYSDDLELLTKMFWWAFTLVQQQIAFRIF